MSFCEKMDLRHEELIADFMNIDPSNIRYVLTMDVIREIIKRILILEQHKE